MYESFFRFSERPFAAAPRADRYFPASTIESARKTLIRCIERAEGAGLVVGPTGSGKTLLCQVLAEQFRDAFRVVHLASGRFSDRRAMLQAVLFELGLPYRDMEEGELRLSLIDHLAPSEQCPHGMVLLVDEAHSLPIGHLEEIRMITNVVRDGQPRVRLVMAGGPALEERLTHPKLEPFSQRLTARCYLEPLRHAETAAYVRAQIAAVGGRSAALFTGDALDAVHQATSGVPRLINQVCDHALILACAGGRQIINGAGIEEAWADLQQLPTPWNESDQAGEGEDAGHDSVIEFGRLDDAEPALGAPAAFADEDDSPWDEAEDASKDATTSVDGERLFSAGPGRAQPGLSVHDPVDPFGEPFAEEEVLIDRYASLASADAAGRVSASRPAERSLSELLTPFGHRAETPRAEAEHVEAPTPVDEPSAQADDDASHVAPAGDDEELARQLASPADDPVMPEERITVELPPPRRAEAPAKYIAPEDEPEVDPAPDDENDADMIIVEDDNVEPPARPLRPAPARRQEYRQLFAKLRKG